MSRSVLRLGTALSLLITLLSGAAVLAGDGFLHADEVAYISYHNVNPDIFLTDTRHGRTHNLTRHDGYDGSPAWSPDGTQIAFVSDREGSLTIYVMDATGRNIRPLIPEGGGYMAPRWTSDGQSILFQAIRAGQPYYIINRDGTNMRELSVDESAPNRIALELGIEPGNMTSTRSPNGAWSLAMRYRDDNWTVYLSRGVGEEGRRLVSLGRVSTERPVWSPDSRQVAFIAYENGSYDLFTVEIAPDGSSSQPRRLTNGRSMDAAPTWRP